MGDLTTFIISTSGFVLAFVNSLINIYLLIRDPSEENMQHIFNSFSMLFGAAASYWFPLSEVESKWELSKFIVGCLVAILGPLADVAVHRRSTTWLFLPTVAGVDSLFMASMFSINKRLAAISPFIPKVFNLIAVTIPIAGFFIFSHWNYYQLEIYNAFFGAAYNFCWIADSNGNTIDLVLIYTASCARVIYGILILYRYCGAEARKHLIDKVKNFFRPLVNFFYFLWNSMCSNWEWLNERTSDSYQHLEG